MTKRTEQFAIKYLGEIVRSINSTLFTNGNLTVNVYILVDRVCS